MSLRWVLLGMSCIALAGCGDDDNPQCPHSVVDRTSKVALTASDACALGQKVVVGYFGPHIDLAACRAACGDAEVTVCFLPGEYSDKTLGDAGPCPAPAGGADVELTCQVTHTEGTYHSGCPEGP